MVKRAYLDHALRFHPDRLQDRSPDALERAEFRMREINAAWEVLRNPAARARYDDELAGREADPLAHLKERTAGPHGHAAGGVNGSSTTVARGTGTGERWQPSGATPWGPGRPPPTIGEAQAVADLAPAGAEEPGLSLWWKLGPVLLGGVVLLVLIILMASAVNRGDGRGVKVDTVELYPVGSCVAVTTDEAAGTDVPGEQAKPVVVEVPCTGPRSGQVLAKTKFPLSCPAGRPFLLPGEDTILCLGG